MSITGATSAASMSHATLVGARPGPANTPPPPGTTAGPEFLKRLGGEKIGCKYRFASRPYRRSYSTGCRNIEQNF
jgi:hypothetical protein